MMFSSGLPYFVFKKCEGYLYLIAILPSDLLHMKCEYKSCVREHCVALVVSSNRSGHFAFMELGRANWKKVAEPCPIEKE